MMKCPVSDSLIKYGKIKEEQVKAAEIEKKDYRGHAIR